MMTSNQVQEGKVMVQFKGQALESLTHSSKYIDNTFGQVLLFVCF